MSQVFSVWSLSNRKEKDELWPSCVLTLFIGVLGLSGFERILMASHKLVFPDPLQPKTKVIRLSKLILSSALNFLKFKKPLISLIWLISKAFGGWVVVVVIGSIGVADVGVYCIWPKSIFTISFHSASEIGCPSEDIARSHSFENHCTSSRSLSSIKYPTAFEWRDIFISYISFTQLWFRLPKSRAA